MRKTWRWWGEKACGRSLPSESAPISSPSTSRPATAPDRSPATTGLSAGSGASAGRSSMSACSVRSRSANSAVICAGAHARVAQSAVGGQDGGEHARARRPARRLPRSNGTSRRSSASVGVGDVLDPQGRGDLAGDLVQQLGLALALLELAVDLGVVDGEPRPGRRGPATSSRSSAVKWRSAVGLDQDEQTDGLVADDERHRQDTSSRPSASSTRGSGGRGRGRRSLSSTASALASSAR